MTPRTPLLLCLLLGCLAPGARSDEPAAPSAEAPATTTQPAAATAPVAVQVHAGLEEACAASLQDQAPVLLVFSAQWCGPCKRLAAETLEDAAFLQNAGPLHLVRADVDLLQDLARAYQVTAVPDLVLLTAEQKIVTRRRGYAAPAELQAWLEAGRQRLAAGEWESSAANELDPTPAKPAELVLALGDPDPARRAQVGQVLLTHNKAGVDALLAGLRSPTLGVRVGVCDLLNRIAPDCPPVDPWAKLDERSRQTEAALAWWKKTGKLPKPAKTAPDARIVGDIENDLLGVLESDPVRRTECMGRLVRWGDTALPALRAALERLTRSDDRQGLALLEDVRWAILVPGTAERALHVRRALARGTGEERCAAAERLGQGGGPALPALAELLREPDPLVREAAIHALQKIGSPRALNAIADLLTAPESNLRMVAAQALGQSRNRSVAAKLVQVVQDPDEVVACVALAALRELKAKESGPRLLPCLQDERWRVRSAAAEALGDFKTAAAGVALERLLDDPDPFVVRNALTALRAIGQSVQPEKLLAMVRAMPDLALPVSEFAIALDNAQGLSVVLELYRTVPRERRTEIVQSLAGRNYFYREPEDAYWQPLLLELLHEEDVALRRRLIEILKGRSTAMVCLCLDDLLRDGDAEVRRGAASLLLRVAAFHMGLTGDSRHIDHGVLKHLPVAAAPATPPAAGSEAPAGGFLESLASFADSVLGAQTASADTVEEQSAQKAVRARQLVPKYQTWHAAMTDVAASQEVSAPERLALAATRLPQIDPAELAAALAHPQLQNDLKDFEPENLAALIMARLPMPQGQDALQRAADVSPLLPYLLKFGSAAPEPSLAVVLDHDRILQALLSGSDEQQETLIEQLLHKSAPQSLLQPANEPLLRRLWASEQPVARSLAVFAAGRREDAFSREIAEAARTDADPWVRRAAAQAVGRAEDLELRERRLGLLATDLENAVAATAAGLILEPEFRKAGSMHGLNYYRFRDITVYVEDDGRDEERPPQVLPRQPPFLGAVRRRLQEMDPEESEARAALALLLAQYGDFSGLQDQLTRWRQSPDSVPTQLLKFALLLTRDPIYLPVLEEEVKTTSQEYELRRLLTYLRGVPGDEPRRLRREINRRLRQP